MLNINFLRCGAGIYNILLNFTAVGLWLWYNWTWVYLPTCCIPILFAVNFDLLQKVLWYTNACFFVFDASLAHVLICTCKLLMTLINTFGAENYMMGYRIVFDREHMKLAWSKSNCKYRRFLWFCSFQALIFLIISAHPTNLTRICNYMSEFFSYIILWNYKQTSQN